MEAKTRGAWVLHHADKLEAVVNRTDFENIALAGKSGLLLSALAREDDVAIENARVEALAKANNITKAELPLIKTTLKSQKLIDVGQNGIDVLGATTGQVLSHVSGVLDSLEPSAEEEAVITLAEVASEAPLDTAAAAKFIRDAHKLSSGDASDLLTRAEDFGFVDGEEIDKQTRLLFNGNLFRRDHAEKIQKVLASLSQKEMQVVTEANDLLRRNGCVPRLDLEKRLSKPVFDKLQSIGMFDVSTVANANEQVEYVTRPHAFGKYGDPFVEDALDNAKAFVACLNYGMTRRDPGQGRISMLARLLTKLINGAWVGPATAIGEDYHVLETRGVVQVRPANGLFHMKLLKPDVGRLALKVLTDGDASEDSLTNFPGAAVSRFGKPEQNRSEARRRRPAKASQRGERDILVALRSGRTR